MLDLTANEANGLLALGAQEARALMNEDVETSRALQIARMEELSFQARDAGDLGMQMKAQKELGSLTGVTKAERANELEALIGVITSVNAEQKEDILQIEATEIDSGPIMEPEE
jgi:N-acyl-D-aspartate/D-glutamate deacylase